MKLYLISQNTNNDYDTFSDAVVCAPDVETARNMNPRNGKPMTDKDWNYWCSGWAPSYSLVNAKFLGVAHASVDAGVVCASFNTG